MATERRRSGAAPRTAAARAPRAPGDRRRARPRGHQLQRRTGSRRRSRRSSSRRSTCSRSASGSARSSRRSAGCDYVRVRRHRHGRHGGAVLVGVPGDVRDVRQVQVPAHLRRDPRRAGRHRGARDRRGAVDRRPRRRLRLHAAARRRCCSGSTRRGGCCSCRSSASIAGFGWACFGISSRRVLKSIDDFSYMTSTRDHAAVPRRRARSSRSSGLPEWAQVASNSTRCTTASSWCTHAVVRLPGLDRPRPPRRSSSCSRWSMWRLAIWRHGAAPHRLSRALAATLRGHAAGAGHRAGHRSSWSSSRRSTSATSSSRAAGMAKRWHPDIAPPGKQFEHERHLKAINEAADQLESLAEGSRGGSVSRNAVKVSAAAARARARRGGPRAPTRTSSAGARPAADRAKHDPFGSRVPDHSVVHRYARCVSYPEWGVGTVSGIYFTGDGDDVQQWARVKFAAGRAHGPGRLAAVRRLLQARPGRRARRSAS